MTTTQTPTAAGQPLPPVMGRKRQIALIVVLLGLLLDLMDIVIVNVALPSIREVGASDSDIQWVAAGYTLAFACLLITAGRLGDRYGRKRVFLIGVLGFTLASFACGISQTPDQLIVARVIQGAMGAAMVPQVLSIIQVMFLPAERGKAFGTLSLVFATGTVGGPIIGALLTGSDIAGLGWRSIFLINLPLGLFVFVAGLLTIPESRSESARGLDVKGFVLATLFLVMIVFPILRGPEEDWAPWLIASLVAAPLVLVALLLLERRATFPLLPLSLFRLRSLNGGLLVSLLFMGGVMPFFFINMLYLQSGLGYGVLHAGFTGILWGIGVPLLGAISARRITPRIGRLGLQLGLTAILLAMVALIAIVRLVGDPNSAQLAPALLLGGAGMGMTFASLMTYTLNDVPVNDAGSASGLFNTVQQVGAVLGISICGAIFFNLVGTGVDANLPSARSELSTRLVAAGLPEPATAAMVAKMPACVAVSVHAAVGTTPAECLSIPAAGGLTGASAEKVAAIVEDTRRVVDQEIYQRAMSRTLYYQVVVFILALLASFALPRRV